MGRSLCRVAVFFDGGYFDEVSRYYKFQHSRRSRLNVMGVLEFIRHRVAEREGVAPHLCRIVDAHYFRGRFSTEAAAQAGKLEDERRFDEILMRAGIAQHYLPVDESRGRPIEKGIDVLLSLEAYDLVVHKSVDVLALVACDGDYVPLVRKLHGIGCRVAVLAWDFQYEYRNGDGEIRRKETRTSSELKNVCTYLFDMSDELGRVGPGQDQLIDGVFVV